MRLRKAIKSFNNIICAIFLGILFIAFIGNVSSKVDALYNLVKFKSYVIVSNSMQPIIDPGDVIFIKKININALKVGDVITFEKDSFIATHRIIEIQEDKVITQGDNNNISDEPIDKSSIIGEYILSIPKVGYLYSFAGSPIGIIALIGVIAIFIIYEFCFVKNKKNDNDNDIKM